MTSGCSCFKRTQREIHGKAGSGFRLLKRKPAIQRHQPRVPSIYSPALKLKDLRGWAETAHYAQSHPTISTFRIPDSSSPDPRERGTTAPDRCPSAQFRPTLPPLARQSILGCPLHHLARLAQILIHRSARYCGPMASSGIPLLLEMEEPVSLAWTTPSVT